MSTLSQKSGRYISCTSIDDEALHAYEYQGWTWSEKYPGWKELRQYFEHVDKQLDIRKDVAFNSRVVSAQFNTSTNKWEVETEDGRKATCRYLVPALGFAAKRHFPDWPGLENFKGDIYHSSFWPESGLVTMDFDWVFES